jgi:hypothetical protein
MDERIVVTLTLANEGTHILRLDFETAQRYDLLVFRGERMVWRWSENKLFAQLTGQLTLRPRESRQFDQTIWAKSLGRGDYDVIAFLTTTPPLHGETSFVIK